MPTKETAELVKQVLDALETVLMALTGEQRRRVLKDSVDLYKARGFSDLARAIQERLEREPHTEALGAPVSLTAERVARTAPETVAGYSMAISFEGSPGCTLPECRAFILGVEVGQLNARLGAKPPEWSGTYHAENITMLERVATAKGYSAVVERTADPTWVFVTYNPLPTTHRLAIVPQVD